MKFPLSLASYLAKIRVTRLKHLAKHESLSKHVKRASRGTNSARAIETTKAPGSRARSMSRPLSLRRFGEQSRSTFLNRSLCCQFRCTEEKRKKKEKKRKEKKSIGGVCSRAKRRAERESRWSGPGESSCLVVSCSTNIRGESDTSARWTREFRAMPGEHR